MISLKPKKRSKLRIYFGKKAYRLKRYSEWHTDGKKYAKKLSGEKLSHTVIQHRTPLLRKLKEVDMELQYNKTYELEDCCKAIEWTCDSTRGNVLVLAFNRKSDET